MLEKKGSDSRTMQYSICKTSWIIVVGVDASMDYDPELRKFYLWLWLASNLLKIRTNLRNFLDGRIMYQLD